MTDTPGEVIPGDREGAVPGKYRLPAADFVTQTLVWVFLFVLVLLSVYTVMGPLSELGLVTGDRGAVWRRLGVWVVPAAAAMALLRVAGLAGLVDKLVPVPVLLFMAVYVLAWIVAATLSAVLQLLDGAGIGVYTQRAWPRLVLGSQAFMLWLLFYVAYKPRPAGAQSPAAEGEDVAAGALAGKAARYRVRLMFEWGGGCLWCGNDAAREAFDVGPIEDRLPLTPGTRQRLEELSRWHDTSLDRDDPAGPSPWPPGESARFDLAAAELLDRIRAELGPDFQVEYVRL
ncbi:MAG TPA: hypothetical protein VHG08_00595 [Longimicrobium sp.]|nr:hypothetical protein [Longimicrobium sp.]